MKRFHIVAVSLLIGLWSFQTTSAQRQTAPPADAAPPSPEEARRQDAWREAMLQTPKPGNGCYKATYPKTEWQEVPCTATPPYPQSAARGNELLSRAAVGAGQARTPPPAPEQVSPEETRRRDAWHESMLQTPQPRKGCFTATYPNKEWRETRCAATPSYPQPPRRGPRPLTIGNNSDVSAEVPAAGSFISTATGSFDSVNVTSESGPIGNSGPAVANAYTLQLNTNFFTSSVCPAASTQCRGWQQFVFENDGASGRVYIQYWLIKFNAPCPAGQSWNTFSFSGDPDIYCWKNNSAGAAPATQQPITNLGQLRLTGTVSATGDSVALSNGTTIWSTNGDNAVAASAGWTIAEFNVFGDGGNSSGGGMASFNSGASLVPRTRITYGGTAAPTCSAQGFTGETNNLNFGPGAPGSTPPGPAVFFNESTAGTISNCAAATSVGDTHLRTLNGLFYDFQASGDFILAQVNPDFVVQARQISGAPNWPDTSVNSAVATRMGKTQLALCLVPGARDRGARLYVDGKETNLGAGQSLALSDDVDVVRQGNVYVMRGQRGDSVRAAVNSDYIDVDVGLGRWPADVHGLIANPGGNVNQLEARDGAVFTNPFSFDDLHRRFGESWRVPANESLLSVCGGGGTGGIPGSVFYSTNLNAEVRDRARAACTAAGVKTGPLLDACTLDVAVIGRDQAAQVFVGLLDPVSVGTIVGSASTLNLWPWALWLLVIAIVLWLLWTLWKRKTA